MNTNSIQDAEQDKSTSLTVNGREILKYFDDIENEIILRSFGRNTD